MELAIRFELKGINCLPPAQFNQQPSTSTVDLVVDFEVNDSTGYLPADFVVDLQVKSQSDGIIGKLSNRLASGFISGNLTTLLETESLQTETKTAKPHIQTNSISDELTWLD